MGGRLAGLVCPIHLQSRRETSPPKQAPYEHISLNTVLGSEEDRKDLAGQGFLRLLNELRTIILQDSVILRKEFPHHPIWNDPIFVRKDYKLFVDEVEHSLQVVEEPEEIKVRQIVPEISNQINLLRQDVVRSLKEEKHRTACKLESVDRRLEDFFAGKFAITIHAPNAPAPRVEARTIKAMANPPFRSVAQREPAGMPGPSMSYDAMDVNEASYALPPLQPDSPPSYQMSRTITTVMDVWREWEKGLGGNYPVINLERMYGARWRMDQSERMLFSRRKVILQELERRRTANPNMDPEAIAEELDAVRRDLKKSLHGLTKWLQTHNG